MQPGQVPGAAAAAASGCGTAWPPATHPETSSEEQEDDEDQEDLPPNQEARSSRAGGVLAPFRSLPSAVGESRPSVLAKILPYLLKCLLCSPVHGVVLGPLEGLQPQEEAAGEPARSKLARIHHFLSFLANGGRWSSTWTALENVRRIYEWPEHLLRGGKAVTTIKLYFVNIMEFMGYFKETPPPTFRVSKRTLVAVHRVLSSTVSSLGRRVAIHQIQVKSAKLRHLVPKRHLRACRARCREEILCVLDNLEKDSTWEHMRKFYPLLSLYISCVYGHRTGVLQNDRSGGQARSSRDKE
ncbi:uncharacterized protein LOC103460166 isoform X1 [Poecilia reticulata]|uniref:uncharacterized protein LOC103460166 isoform X1 n=1 Tax=Poecilia reticulata TaxID=8081 RepID=UPI0004A349B3|nr:PREDICTED: uncharacterized protein LOC103460166 isoform X1 [Poecilia reticulata]